MAKISNIDYQINEAIRDKEVRLVDENGEQLGIVKNDVAQRMAEERELDLVKIAPQAVPPVCKLMDYSKYRFEMQKREKEQRKNQKTIQLKEVRLSATIDVHDMQVKAKNATKFLKDGDKVKVSIRFRGRQMTYANQGKDVMNKFYEGIFHFGAKAIAGGPQYDHDPGPRKQLRGGLGYAQDENTPRRCQTVRFDGKRKGTQTQGL